MDGGNAPLQASAPPVRLHVPVLGTDTVQALDAR